MIQCICVYTLYFSPFKMRKHRDRLCSDWSLGGPFHTGGQIGPSIALYEAADVLHLPTSDQIKTDRCGIRSSIHLVVRFLHGQSDVMRAVSMPALHKRSRYSPVICLFTGDQRKRSPAERADPRAEPASVKDSWESIRGYHSDQEPDLPISNH